MSEDGFGAKVISDLKASKPQWFTTDKPLPDGDYGWRLHREDTPGLKSIKNGELRSIGTLQYERVLYFNFSIGEWIKIEFPE